MQGVGAGQLYGYKVRGEYRPECGLRFNDAKLLLDPYAKAVTGKFRNIDNLLLAYDAQPGAGERVARHARQHRDRAEGDRRRRRLRLAGRAAAATSRSSSWSSTRCTSRASPRTPRPACSSPGTYLGFIEKIPHLTRLGVNAVELLPVHEYYVDDFLVERGLTNYWGYNSIGFFAPESSYGTRTRAGLPGRRVQDAGARAPPGGHQGHPRRRLQPHRRRQRDGADACRFRGIDNPSYYSLTGPPDAPRRYYMNYTGCGNSLNFDSPAVIRLVMDSLRYWVEMMHVDGFRFDLASVLGRTAGRRVPLVGVASSTRSRRIRC